MNLSDEEILELYRSQDVNNNLDLLRRSKEEYKVVSRELQKHNAFLQTQWLTGEISRFSSIGIPALAVIEVQRIILTLAENRLVPVLRCLLDTFSPLLSDLSRDGFPGNVSGIPFGHFASIENGTLIGIFSEGTYGDERRSIIVGEVNRIDNNILRLREERALILSPHLTAPVGDFSINYAEFILEDEYTVSLEEWNGITHIRIDRDYRILVAYKLKPYGRSWTLTEI